uniref:KICSTOR complex protein kaptin isoform X2 n=1 Tax=Myxine glutinosa TaxID=7769 RepID=UPI00358E7438
MRMDLRPCPCPFIEDNYVRLTSQSNVFGLAPIERMDGKAEVLVVTLKGNVIGVGYGRSAGRLRGVARQLPFTYIPVDAEIVSIDAFNKLDPQQGLVVGIAFVKDARDKVSPFLNIYCDYEPGSEYNLDSVAQSCLNLALDFIPLQLCHAEVFIDGRSEMVFLLSGHDQAIHLYKESDAQQCFEELPVADLFPELDKIPNNVLCLDVMNLPGTERRLTAFSCQNGVVSVSHVQKSTKVILQQWSVQQEGPVPRVQLCSLPRNHDEDAAHPVGHEEPEIPERHCYSLVVASALEVTVVYRDVLCQGLDQQELLPGSDCFDSVVCALVVDTDYNGVGEILLGTYGQELLCYKWHGDTVGQRPADKDHEEEVAIAGWKLAWSWTFHSPLLALASADVTGDGLNELIVVTTRGLHVLQQDLHRAAELVMARLRPRNMSSPHLAPETVEIAEEMKE